MKSNICKLRRDSCKSQLLIELEYEGPCDRCKSVSCPYYGTCTDDGFKVNCGCDDSCTDVNLIKIIQAFNDN
jgi:hypothetical protein